MTADILIRGARLHNLKNITLAIPREKLVVLTGVSGSGKSTLAFDILHREGQRQYLESLGLLSWGMARPPVDSISGLSPSISIGQDLTRQNPRSTVGTLTDAYTYLRVLYARLGHQPCPTCGQDVPCPTCGQDAPPDSLVTENGPGQEEDAPEKTFPCPHCGMPVHALNMANFSFNKPAGACPACTGLGRLHQVDIPRLVDGTKSLADGAVSGWNEFLTRYHSANLKAAAAYYGFKIDLSHPVKDYSPALRDLLFYGVESPHFRRHVPAELKPPATVRQGRFEGLVSAELRRYSEHIEKAGYREKAEELLVIQTCPDCAGTRLRPESRAVTVGGQSIVSLAQLPLSRLQSWLGGLPALLHLDENLISRPILADLQERIHRLIEAGAGYLSLERDAPSLSAGEAQRLRLAGLLGSGLTGVLYVLDEPTIGMHPHDTPRLVALLRRLRDLGNTVLVIEHDLEMIAAADYVVDFGPGGGKHGGEVVALGTPAEVTGQPGSITGDYLAHKACIPVPEVRRRAGEKAITLRGACHHNLKNITFRLPLGLLTAVTGLSGSGKSSLVFGTLDRALRQKLYSAAELSGEHELLEGWQFLNHVITIDQKHLSRMTRSNTATYTDAFTPIRQAFASTVEANRRGLTPRDFSFNVAGGRCERCEGTGVLAVKMHFLPDVEVRCPACAGHRYKEEVLAVRYRDVDISQVLELTIEEALQVFGDIPAARSRLQVLSDAGLGYLPLGQPATTLSGGEAQRVKLAKELGRRVSGHILYLLDEPTTGLHLADTTRLLELLQRLVVAGNTVLVVEHNLELVKAADWVVDLGPEGGEAGGRIIAEGTPEDLASAPGSYTGQLLGRLLPKFAAARG